VGRRGSTLRDGEASRRATAAVPKTAERRELPSGSDSRSLRLRMRKPTGDGSCLMNRYRSVRFRGGQLAGGQAGEGNCLISRRYAGSSPARPTAPLAPDWTGTWLLPRTAGVRVLWAARSRRWRNRIAQAPSKRKALGSNPR
jgi:hypothetical protein